jgi:uncharacterized damage-inducible protein DinB
VYQLARKRQVQLNCVFGDPRAWSRGAYPKSSRRLLTRGLIFYDARATEFSGLSVFPGKSVAVSTLHSLMESFQFNRPRTLAVLDKIEQEKEPQKVLGWRPGSGRAHIAWQLMHIGITEELFATERLVPGNKPAFADLVPRFKGGSTPDDNIPSPATIRQVLSESRAHLLETLGRFGDNDLGTIPEFFKERKLALGDVLRLISWHEAHHQGQAHITLNLYKATQGGSSR